MPFMGGPQFKRSALAVAVFGASVYAQAGIISIDQCPGEVNRGCGGWNFDNVDITINAPGHDTFDKNCCNYTHDGDESFSYFGTVRNEHGTGLGQVLAKDWPVGEPPGIKVVHNDEAVKPGKPTNCVMATSYLEDHFLDSADPQQVICSGPFQSHKRFKLAMLPETVAGGAGNEEGIDLVFNVENEYLDDERTTLAPARSYQIFQKINNWTNHRLQGFTVQVGTGLGESFVPASASRAIGVSNLSLSVPVEVWEREDQLANFSAGLFGPVDDKHDRPAGYFDPEIRAGFKILEYGADQPGNTSGQIDTLHSNGTLGSDYVSLPPGAGAAPGYQFGPWLPNTMLPYGIFFDDDGNPETDAELMAWYGFHPQRNAMGWMTGVADGFAEIPAETVISWGSNLEYTMGEIDDLVNVGLNYVVTIDDVSGFPGYAEPEGKTTFTIRITPQLDASGTPPPMYLGQAPEPALTFASDVGVVEVSPYPSFEVGSLLTARVGDASEALGEEVTVTVTTVPAGVGVAPISETISLVEQGEGRNVFAATLPEEFSNINPGDAVTVTYIDADDGLGGINVERSVTTQAIAVGEPPLPAPAVVYLTDLSVPETVFNGKTSRLSVGIQSSKESESLAAGTVTLLGVNESGVEVASFSEDFSDLRIGGKDKFNWKWIATLQDSAIAETITWTATLDLDEGVDRIMTGETLIELKVKGKDR